MLVLAMFVTILPESTQAALSGDVTDPFHYYYIYAKPKVTDKN